METLWIAALGVAVFFLVVAAMLIWNTWRERRRITQMARDQQWRAFISQVKDRLDSIGADADDVLSRHSDWFHQIWRREIMGPAAAVEKWIAEKTNRTHG